MTSPPLPPQRRATDAPPPPLPDSAGASPAVRAQFRQLPWTHQLIVALMPVITALATWITSPHTDPAVIARLERIERVVHALVCATYPQSVECVASAAVPVPAVAATRSASPDDTRVARASNLEDTP